MSNTPSNTLVAPTPSDPIPDLVENVIGASQYISVSYWTDMALKAACGVNPGQWVSEQFSGNWEKVQEAGAALKNLAEFNIEFGRSVRSGLSDVSHDWNGVAADQADNYFTALAKGIQDQEDTLTRLGNKFDETAVGMYEAANSIKGFLEMLLDLAIAAGLEAAAAAASSETVVGPVLAGAAFVATITKAMGVWGKVIQAHTIAWNGAQALVGVVAGYASTLKDIEKQTLPKSNYQHPEV